MAHEPRRANVEALQAALGDVPVAWDPLGVRPRSRSVWPVRRAALELAEPAAAYHLILQDDAEVAPGFWRRLEAVRSAADGCLISLYVRARTRPRSPDLAAALGAALTAGAAGFRFPRAQFGLALMFPTATIAELIEAGDGMAEVRADDVRIRVHYLGRGIETYYPLPSLVEHRPDLRGRNGPNRTRAAAWFE